VENVITSCFSIFTDFAKIGYNQSLHACNTVSVYANCIITFKYFLSATHSLILAIQYMLRHDCFLCVFVADFIGF